MRRSPRMLAMSRPWSRIARKFSPRAHSTTSSPDARSRAPKYAPTAPAPITRIFISPIVAPPQSVVIIPVTMESASETSLPNARELLFDAVLAVATLTLWPILDERSQGTAAQRSRAMVYFPIVGFVLGVILALVDRTAGFVAGPLGRSFIVLVVGAMLSLGLANRGVADTVEVLRRGKRPASTGLTRIGPVGAGAAIVAFAFEVWCLS